MLNFRCYISTGDGTDFPKASGSLGTPVLSALIRSGRFNLTVLKRPASSATYPSSVTVTEADLASLDSVTSALKGQDAVVSTLGTAGLPGQPLIVDAAVQAGVKRFLPSDFGCDIANPKAGVMPVFKYKVDTHKHLREVAASNPSFTYSLVCTNAFLDWGLEKNFLLNWSESKPKLYDGGNSIFSATTLDTIGDAVVGVLSHPEETKNRFVYVKDIDVSQKQLLEIAKKIDPSKKWEEPTNVDTAELEKSSNESLAKGQVTLPVMFGYLFRAIFGPPEYGGHWKQTDNELLGIKGKTEADVEDIFKKLMLG